MTEIFDNFEHFTAFSQFHNTINLFLEVIHIKFIDFDDILMVQFFTIQELLNNL